MAIDVLEYEELIDINSNAHIKEVLNQERDDEGLLDILWLTHHAVVTTMLLSPPRSRATGAGFLVGLLIFAGEPLFKCEPSFVGVVQ